jgi:spore coat protein U-like protein
LNFDFVSHKTFFQTRAYADLFRVGPFLMATALFLMSFMSFIAMKHKRTLHTLGLLIAIFLAMPVYAVCTNINVSTGSFGTITTQNNITNYHLADITVTCDSSADTYKLGINAGSHYASSRQLAHAGGQFISYALFQGSGGVEWGDIGVTLTTYPQLSVSGSGTNSYSIYAVAATKDKAPQGNYSDTVTVTLADSVGTPLKTISQLFSLDLLAFCTLNTNGATGQFGSYPLESSTTIANVNLGSVAVTCPPTIAYKVGIDKGLHLTGGIRHMALNEHLIPYTLKYGNDGVEWGDGGLHNIDSSYIETFATASAVLGTGTAQAQFFDLYGDASIINATAVGIYTDTLIITLAW